VNGSGYSTIFKGEGLLQHSSSSVSLGQGGRQMMPLNHHHSQSYSNLQSNFYSDSNSNGHTRGADPRYSQNGQYQPPQWATGELNPVISSSTSSHAYNGVSAKTIAQSQCSAPMYMHNGDRHAAITAEMNGTANYTYTTPTDSIHLTTPTSTGDMKCTNRQNSNTSSGYGTERHSVVSMLSRDQSLSEICIENSLQVNSTPHRKISAPPNYNCSPKTKKMLSQQSHSLTNLTQDIPEYPYDNEENNEQHGGEECRGHPSLQRQDTGHASKVVFAGSEASIDREQYQSVMGSKRKMPKQNAVEEGT
jgi:hypothetical protein